MSFVSMRVLLGLGGAACGEAADSVLSVAAVVTTHRGLQALDAPAVGAVILAEAGIHLSSASRSPESGIVSVAWIPAFAGMTAEER
ncbi:hypothetical protein, partial [Lysobacter sp.]|uniref:hypothetical protein n=1 Tax=Lysobacter sp. TaxID=72226 RepID=UPI002D797EB2